MAANANSTNPALQKVNEPNQSRFTIGIQLLSSAPTASAPAPQANSRRIRSMWSRFDNISKPVQHPNNTVIALPRKLIVV